MSDGTQDGAGGGAGTASKPLSQRRSSATRPRNLPLYHVVLLNDDDHTHEYVIEMLKSLFGHPDHQGFQLAELVDRDGRAIVWTSHKEIAELKREQIHAFGADHRVPTCAGSMSAIIEPAEG